MIIIFDSVVMLYYIVFIEDGIMLDFLEGKLLLVVLLGCCFLIEGLEDVFIGKLKEDSFNVLVNFEKVYGECVDEFV